MEACESCKTTGQKFNRCGRCRSTVYCSKECQIAHWPFHKPKCKPSKQADLVVNYIKYEQQKLKMLMLEDVHEDPTKIPLSYREYDDYHPTDDTDSDEKEEQDINERRLIVQHDHDIRQALLDLHSKLINYGTFERVGFSGADLFAVCRSEAACIQRFGYYFDRVYLSLYRLKPGDLIDKILHVQKSSPVNNSYVSNLVCEPMFKPNESVTHIVLNFNDLASLLLRMNFGKRHALGLINGKRNISF
ncbi:unnamed protein product [Didymodactylos carnosus]|uniref:MYND-type domain-containing protein n=1 Tax=Didymodactylos carnosus TaxID=1234261 RepID=A0A814S044_9BILA|nr:unnamed protein product [Didymodactylos carnosus]CAF1140863.1 unnamed protein product [Didymodactylos carnosus]CAF3843290.1 unnamed protein product [Didymodactylos carnosus]CAF3904568.1 unnamed protein product [Didymodactylos carnosus]